MKKALATLMAFVLYSNCIDAKISETLITDDDSLSADFEFEELFCEDATPPKCERIRKESRFKPGQIISDKDLKNAKIRIQLLGLFKDVHLKLKKGSKKGKIVVAVSTKNESPIYSVTGVEVGSRNRFNGAGLNANIDLTVGHRDLFGLGKNLSLSARGSGNTNAGDNGSLLLRYSDPNILGSRKWFYNLELFAGQNRYNTYQEDEIVGAFEIGKRYGSFSYWTIGYARSHTNVFESSDGSGRIDSDYVTAGYGYNTQDDLYFPTEGSRINFRMGIPTNTKTTGTLVSENVLLNFDWRTTFRVDNKVFLTSFFESRNNLFEQDDFINRGLGVELAYQPIQNQKEQEITDLRYYIAPSLLGYSSFRDGVLSSVSAGVKFRSKTFGLVRLGTFWSHE